MGMMSRVLLSMLLCASAQAQTKFITVASTTSTEQSGLFKHMLPLFEQKSGIQVRVVALGTGQALDMGRRGDADVVFVHAKALEENFVAEGHGVKRLEVMYNDFVLVGPKSDPAKVGGTKDIVAALQKIKAAQAAFASRGDKSGTHFAELQLWKAAGVDIAKDKGPWYRDTGSGMGPTLNTAAGMNAYALADRGTWLSFKNRGELHLTHEFQGVPLKLDYARATLENLHKVWTRGVHLETQVDGKKKLLSYGGTGWIMTAGSLGILVAMDRAQKRREAALFDPATVAPAAQAPSSSPAIAA